MNFLLKTVVGVTVMIWVRWTLPRLRIDQVMETCLKYCVPIAAICFLGVVTWQVNALPSLGELLGTRVEPYQVRESWVLQAMPGAPQPQPAPHPEPTAPAHISAAWRPALPAAVVAVVSSAAPSSTTKELP